MLSVALIQTFSRFRALPGMLPCGVRTFLGHQFARGHPANLVIYYTFKGQKWVRMDRYLVFGIRNQVFVTRPDLRLQETLGIRGG